MYIVTCVLIVLFAIVLNLVGKSERMSILLCVLENCETNCILRKTKDWQQMNMPLHFIQVRCINCSFGHILHTK